MESRKISNKEHLIDWQILDESGYMEQFKSELSYCYPLSEVMNKLNEINKNRRNKNENQNNENN